MNCNLKFEFKFQIRHYWFIDDCKLGFVVDYNGINCEPLRIKAYPNKIIYAKVTKTSTDAYIQESFIQIERDNCEILERLKRISLSYQLKTIDFNIIFFVNVQMIRKIFI